MHKVLNFKQNKTTSFTLMAHSHMHPLYPNFLNSKEFSELCEQEKYTHLLKLLFTSPKEILKDPHLYCSAVSSHLHTHTFRKLSFLHMLKLAFVKGDVTHSFIETLALDHLKVSLEGKYNKYGFYRLYEVPPEIHNVVVNHEKNTKTTTLSRSVSLVPVNHINNPEMNVFLTETSILSEHRYSFGDYEFSINNGMIQDFIPPRGVGITCDGCTLYNNCNIVDDHQFQTTYSESAGLSLICDYIQYVKNSRILETPIVLPKEKRSFANFFNSPSTASETETEAKQSKKRHKKDKSSPNTPSGTNFWQDFDQEIQEIFGNDEICAYTSVSGSDKGCNVSSSSTSFSFNFHKR